jgi:hypothetical protein
MPAAKTAKKKYRVVAHPFATNKEKGMWVWKQTKAATKEDEPEGSQIYVPAGTIVELTEEAAAPLVATQRLQAVED